MARILICHAPKDASQARDLGAALMGRGHFVSFDGEPDAPRPERQARLRQFEAVIVLWSEISSQNAGLADIARETMPLNLLVPLRAEELAMTRLPLMFRKLNMLTPRDIDGIARVVARMSTAASSLRDMAEREAARQSAGGATSPEPRNAPAPSPQQSTQRAPTPARDGRPAQARPVAGSGEGVRVRPLTDLPEVDAGPGNPVRPASYPVSQANSPSRPATAADRAAPDRRKEADAAQRRPAQPHAQARPATADDLARAIDAGLLMPHIPSAMWLGAPTTVEITLGREILGHLAQPDQGQASLGQSIETLSVSLYGSTEAFEIERQSERTQFVSVKHALAAHDPATFGRWAWIVTPGVAGPQDLVVRISALLRDPRGVPAPVAIPDRRFSIDIQVPEGESLASALAGWYRR